VAENLLKSVFVLLFYFKNIIGLNIPFEEFIDV
jgi:hypothetical protein